MPRRARKSFPVRSEVMHFRVTPDEKSDIQLRAHRAGMSVGEFLTVLAATRNVTFVERKYQPIDPVLFAELRRIGNNLNQLAHAANSGLPPSALATVQAARELVNAICRNDILRRLADEPGEDHAAPSNDLGAISKSVPQVADAFAASGWAARIAEAIK